MHNLSPEYFFDLTQFAHADLFNDCHYVWEALLRIKIYLQKIPLGKIEVAIPRGPIWQTQKIFLSVKEPF